jgi:hypothetical protein
MAPDQVINLIRSFEFLILIAIAWLLWFKYLKTNDKTYLWLGIPFFIWPVISFSLDAVERIWVDNSVAQEPYLLNIAPFSWLLRGQISIGKLVLALNSLDRLVWSILVLVTLFMIFRKSLISTSHS